MSSETRTNMEGQWVLQSILLLKGVFLDFYGEFPVELVLRWCHLGKQNKESQQQFRELPIQYSLRKHQEIGISNNNVKTIVLKQFQGACFLGRFFSCKHVRGLCLECLLRKLEQTTVAMQLYECWGGIHIRVVGTSGLRLLVLVSPYFSVI